MVGQRNRGRTLRDPVQGVEEGAGGEIASSTNFQLSSVLTSWFSRCALALEMGTSPKTSLIKHSPPACFPPRISGQHLQSHTIN